MMVLFRTFQTCLPALFQPLTETERDPPFKIDTHRGFLPLQPSSFVLRRCVVVLQVWVHVCGVTILRNCYSQMTRSDSDSGRGANLRSRLWRSRPTCPRPRQSNGSKR